MSTKNIKNHTNQRACYLTGVFAFKTPKFDIRANKKKGKAVPLQSWSGPEGSRELRFPDFVTTAQDGGNVVSLTHRPPLPVPTGMVWFVYMAKLQ